jgi:UDP-2,3-diacylglucosamine pyrophosphatase LpxH
LGEHWSNDETAHYVVSDLHLSDGAPAYETWRAAQQAAWERFLRRIPAASDGAGQVELIVNGDCFDCLMAAPYLTTEDATTAAIGRASLDRIIAAHADWFAALGAFLREPGRRVTFLIGNHDLELAFASVRERVRAAVDAPAGTVRFCVQRAYRPAADVEIEHGCQFDPWNAIAGLWEGDASSAATPESLEVAPGMADDLGAVPLPFGSRYYGRVFRPIQQRFPYFDAFAPGLPQPGILALVCVLAPEMLVASAATAATLYDGPPPSHGPDLAAAAAGGAADLYTALLPGMAALQTQVWQQVGMPADGDATARGLTYITSVLAGLRGSARDAIRAIFTVPEPSDAENIAVDALAAATMATRSPAARIALCGHTHGERDVRSAGEGGDTFQYLNTGTWYPRLALPSPDAIDDDMIAWLRAPRAAPSRARDAAAFTFAALRAAPGAPTTARLFQVGANGW